VEGVQGLQMIVTAGSMSIDGVPAVEGTPVSLNQVHHDDVPMPMPDGAAPPFAWTLQPAGATFDPPIKVVYPNMSALPPGSIAYFLSFNHDTNRFDIVATGAVTDDGLCIETDPGVGIQVAGWGCNCPPYSVTGDCDNCDDVPTICVSASVEGELATATNLLNQALSSIPFVDDASVSGSLSGEACSLCCDGEILTPGTISYSGSLTGSATVSKVLSPIDFGFDVTFTIPFTEIEVTIQGTVELGPKIQMTPSLTISAGGSHNLCLNTNCFVVSGCGGAVATLSLTGEASVEAFDGDGNSHGMIGVAATASATANAAASISFGTADCPSAGTQIAGCLGSLTGNVVLKFFGLSFTTPPFTFLPGDPNCGC
jgi:hypothetical protein